MDLPWSDIFLDPIKEMWTLFLTYIPKLLGAIVVLIIGWVVARAVQTVVDRLLSKARFNTLTERAGINEALSAAQIHRPPSTLIARLFFWIVMLVMLSSAVEVLNLPVASRLLDQLVSYIPNVIAAAFILALGFFFGSLVRSFVVTLAGGIKMVNPNTLGQVAQAAIIIFAVAGSLEQLQIATETIHTAFTLLFGGFALGLAIAFGLGCQDIVKAWVNQALKDE